jgi:hypothetical protein
MLLIACAGTMAAPPDARAASTHGNTYLRDVDLVARGVPLFLYGNTLVNFRLVTQNDTIFVVTEQNDWVPFSPAQDYTPYKLLTEIFGYTPWDRRKSTPERVRESSVRLLARKNEDKPLKFQKAQLESLPAVVKCELIHVDASFDSQRPLWWRVTLEDGQEVLCSSTSIGGPEDCRKGGPIANETREESVKRRAEEQRPMHEKIRNSLLDTLVQAVTRSWPNKEGQPVFIYRPGDGVNSFWFHEDIRERVPDYPQRGPVDPATAREVIHMLPSFSGWDPVLVNILESDPESLWELRWNMLVDLPPYPNGWRKVLLSRVPYDLSRFRR